MIKNYIIIALRNLWRQKLYSVLNILGLSVALAVSMIILNYVKTELSYDRHFPKAGRIYRIINKTIGERGAWDWAPTAPLMTEEISEFVPEIESLVRFKDINKTVLENRSDTNNIIQYEEAGGYYTDSTVFDVFDLRIIKGNKNTAFSAIGSIVLTESMAKKYFGDNDPIGKHLYIGGRNRPYTVTAVIAEFPETSHFKIKFLLDWEIFRILMRELNLEDLYNSHGWAGVYTYALIRENVNAGDLKEKLFEFRADFYSKYQSREEITGEFALQSITDIHLKSNLEQEMGPNGNITYIYVFILSIVFILIIAGVNYVNIATSRSFKRLTEVGIRKVVGAKRAQLIIQFQSESMLIVILAAVLSILFIDLALPVYNSITGILVRTRNILILDNILPFISIILILGCLSGLYPSLFVSRFKPVDAIKDIKAPYSSTNLLRRILVIIQFTVSIFMIFSTIVIFRQMNFLQSKKLGFEREHIVVFNLNGKARQMAVYNPQTLKDELGNLSFVQGSAITSQLIGENFSVEGMTPDGLPDDADQPALRFLRVDEDFIPLLHIQLEEGRNFQIPPKGRSEFIVNRKTIEVLNLDIPVGTKATSFFGQYGEIVGVTSNFHFASLHHQIEPLVLEYNTNPEFRGMWTGILMIKLTPGNTPEMLKDLEKQIEKIAPGTVFNYIFLDDKFNQLYKSETNLRDIFKFFAIFTIFISCLGLFGLSAYSAESRTKEIGIRKSNGAHIFGISILISRQFIGYVLIGLIIALPAGYFFSHNWLENFAYHIDIQIFDFILAGMIALIIALLSVSYQSIRSGLMNPARSLRYE